MANVPPSFCFHENCGRLIQLSRSEGLTKATRTPGEGNDDGIVMSQDPMQICNLYQGNVVHSQETHNPVVVGVTTHDPNNHRQPIPRNSFHWENAVCIGSCGPFGSGEMKKLITKTEVGKELQHVGPESKIGLKLDEARNLHLYINQRDKGVAATNVPESCYIFFDLLECCREVTALPPTAI